MEDSRLSSVEHICNETHDEVMKLIVTVNALIARIEAFEKMATSGNVASKRTVKTTPVVDTEDTASISSTGSKQRKQIIVPIEPGEKIVNALTFFKKIVIFKNYENLRAKYTNSEMINQAKEGIKKAEGTEAYWISIGNNIWKILDKDQKKEVREDFNKWKKVHQNIGDNASQLNEDENESS